ncbi:eCIS core domain-containing protein [Chitinophaga defluvii]|uniref:DUF4157 domain-containing protein n=1 Tax=Chitinophaga defluvii TaxID=3163343 RepID=A0ABV2T2S0_9BACT
MKTSSPRYRRHRNPDKTAEKKETPFFAGSQQPLQAKEDAFFQPKLTMGQPGDQYEREADAVADNVVHQAPAKRGGALQQKAVTMLQAMQAPPKEEEKKPPVPEKKKEEEKPLQKKDEKKEKEEEKKTIQAKEEAPEKEEEKKPVQQKEDTPEKKEERPEVMAKQQPDGKQPSSISLDTQLKQQQDKGTPLSPQLRAEMGNAIGADFKDVNIHTDQEAVQMNKQIGAQAFTHGKDIYFNSGKYDPATLAGKRLLAHELTHVVQQGAASPARRRSAGGSATSRQKTTARQVQQQSATPLPEGVKADKKTKIASFKRGDFTVKILPDKTASPKSTAVKSRGAVTDGKIKYRVTPQTKDGKIVSVKIKKELVIQTTYAANAKPAGPSAYGRGTTEEDKKQGNTSLKYHEGNHGQDYMNYITDHPFPELVINEPLTQAEYDQAYKDWEASVQEFITGMEQYSKEKTDETGHPLSEEEAQ